MKKSINEFTEEEKKAFLKAVRPILDKKKEAYFEVIGKKKPIRETNVVSENS